MLGLVVRFPHFRNLWLAGAVSLVGDWLSFVAISLLALGGGGGPLALAMVLAAHSLPRALLSPIAGALVDRFDRRALLGLTAVVQALLTAGMALAAWRGAIALVSILVAVRSSIGALVPTAENAALRNVVPEKDLLPANALVSATWSVTYVAGMALGGALAVLGPVLALALDAASFALAALLVATLPRMKPEREPTSSIIRAMPRDLWHAWKHARSVPDLLPAVLAKAPLALAGGAGWMALNLIAARGPFGSAAVSLGILQAVRGAGTGLGPILAQQVVARGVRPFRLIHVCAAVALTSIALFVPAAGAPVLLLLMGLTWGMGSGSNWVLSSAGLQRLAPDALTGRLASIDELSWTIAMVIGAVFAGLVPEPDILVACLVSVGVALALWVALFRGGRKTASDRGAGDHDGALTAELPSP